MTEYQIIWDLKTSCSSGFGFIAFDSEGGVDGLLSKGNMVDMEGTQVSFGHFSELSTN